ncbi:MAG TPA: TVP38/TMEM64 family protein [Anaeromyxobacteraceae bacterium]|nr:TVP38/TMEM64 family protein [Anaeromyxobacteraceae bacterium]
MKVAVPRVSTGLAVGAIALAAGAYAFLPAVRQGVDAGVRALSAPDGRDAVDAFRSYLLGFGPWAPLASAALMVLQSLVAPLPAFVVTFANGLLFGWARGALLSWSSAMVGAALCFWIARALGRPAVERLAGGGAAVERADRFFERHGERAILLARLLPFVPFDAVSYAAGLTTTGFRPFLVATGLGQIPATLLYSYLGESASGSVRILFWGFSLLAAAMVLLGIAGARRQALRAGRGAGGGPVS